MQWLLPLCFLCLLCLKVCLKIVYDISIDKRGVLVLLLLCLVFAYEKRTTWIMGMLLFAYGVYSMLSGVTHAIPETTMQFTLPIEQVLSEADRMNDIIIRILRLIPTLFYAGSFFLFLAKSTRSQYGWN